MRSMNIGPIWVNPLNMTSGGGLIWQELLPRHYKLDWILTTRDDEKEKNMHFLQLIVKPTSEQLFARPHHAGWLFSWDFPGEIPICLPQMQVWWRSSAAFFLICGWMVMIPFSTASHLYCAFNGKYSHILMRLDQTGRGWFGGFWIHYNSLLYLWS